MTSTALKPIPETLLDQACEWAVRLRSDKVGDRDMQQFADWLASGEDHRAAWEATMDMWSELDVMEVLPLDHLLPENKSKASNDLQSPATDRMIATRPARWRGWALAATLVLAVAATFTTLFRAGPETTVYRTEVGELRHITLADGSAIDLNTNSELSIFLGEDERRILLSRGEAYFVVSPDQQRPFIVSFESGEATALGTEFNVYRIDDRLTRVAVSHGVVRVSESRGSATAAPGTAILRTGDAVTHESASGISDPAPFDPEQLNSWREQKLVFENTDLADVVDALNRYSEMPIDVSYDVAHRKVSGVFSTAYPASTVEALAQSLSLTVRTDNGRVLLCNTEG